jgi:hypothetical protein
VTIHLAIAAVALVLAALSARKAFAAAARSVPAAPSDHDDAPEAAPRAAQLDPALQRYWIELNMRALALASRVWDKGHDEALVPVAGAAADGREDGQAPAREEPGDRPRSCGAR